MFYVLSFIVLLGPLVFIHELGHFLFAKLFNVRCDVFSIGFGPKLIKKTVGETEYCLSAIPLGGYVKLFGQDPTEKIAPGEKNRALRYQDAWKRFLIFFAGPLFNFLFAIFIFGVMMILGEPHITPKVARVSQASQAHVAGFRSGDLITAVDQKVVNKFQTVNEAISKSPNKEMEFRLKRKGDIKEIKITPDAVPGYSIYGESVKVGKISGLYSIGRHPVVGISNPKSVAAKKGLKTGDEILSINGTKVKTFSEFEALAKQARKSGKRITLDYVPRDGQYWLKETRTEEFTGLSKKVELPPSSLRSMGIHPSELFILSVIKDSPAAKTGLKEGDRLVALDGRVLHSFDDLRDRVQEFGKSKGSFSLRFERDGKLLTKKFVPVQTTVKDPIGKEITRFMIGIYPLYIQAEPNMFYERVYNPFTLTLASWSRALDLSAKTLISIKKLIFGQVSAGTLGGPILIGKLAGDSFKRGLIQFLRVMALISISLAVFNILPVPILDGGHIFLLFIEVIRGKPISLRQTELVQQIGLTIIVFLLVFVIFNDMTRVGLPALRRIFE